MNEIERGDRAKEVLKNPAYREAFEAIEKELIELWKQEKSADVRESLWMQQKLLLKVQTQLSTVMVNGKLAREKASLPKRAMDLVRSGLR